MSAHGAKDIVNLTGESMEEGPSYPSAIPHERGRSYSNVTTDDRDEGSPADRDRLFSENVDGAARTGTYYELDDEDEIAEDEKDVAKGFKKALSNARKALDELAKQNLTIGQQESSKALNDYIAVESAALDQYETEQSDLSELIEQLGSKKTEYVWLAQHASKAHTLFNDALKAAEEGLDCACLTLDDYNNYKNQIAEYKKQAKELPLASHQQLVQLSQHLTGLIVVLEEKRGQEEIKLAGKFIGNGWEEEKVAKRVAKFYRTITDHKNPVLFSIKTDYTIKECQLSIAYPEDERAFRIQLSRWITENRTADSKHASGESKSSDRIFPRVLFIFSPGLQKWKAYCITSQNEEPLYEEVNEDSVFGKELSKISPRNLSSYNQSDLQKLLTQLPLFERVKATTIQQSAHKLFVALLSKNIINEGKEKDGDLAKILDLAQQLLVENPSLEMLREFSELIESKTFSRPKSFFSSSKQNIYPDLLIPLGEFLKSVCLPLIQKYIQRITNDETRQVVTSILRRISITAPTRELIAALPKIVELVSDPNLNAKEFQERLGKIPAFSALSFQFDAAAIYHKFYSAINFRSFDEVIISANSKLQEMGTQIPRRFVEGGNYLKEMMETGIKPVLYYAQTAFFAENNKYVKEIEKFILQQTASRDSKFIVLGILLNLQKAFVHLHVVITNYAKKDTCGSAKDLAGDTFDQITRDIFAIKEQLLLVKELILNAKALTLNIRDLERAYNELLAIVIAITNSINKAKEEVELSERSHGLPLITEDTLRAELSLSLKPQVEKVLKSTNWLEALKPLLPADLSPAIQHKVHSFFHRIIRYFADNPTINDVIKEEIVSSAVWLVQFLRGLKNVEAHARLYKFINNYKNGPATLKIELYEIAALLHYKLEGEELKRANEANYEKLKKGLRFDYTAAIAKAWPTDTDIPPLKLAGLLLDDNQTGPSEEERISHLREIATDGKLESAVSKAIARLATKDGVEGQVLSSFFILRFAFTRTEQLILKLNGLRVEDGSQDLIFAIIDEIYAYIAKVRDALRRIDNGSLDAILKQDVATIFTSCEDCLNIVFPIEFWLKAKSSTQNTILSQEELLQVVEQFNKKTSEKQISLSSIYDLSKGDLKRLILSDAAAAKTIFSDKYLWCDLNVEDFKDLIDSLLIKQMTGQAVAKEIFEQIASALKTLKYFELIERGFLADLDPENKASFLYYALEIQQKTEQQNPLFNSDVNGFLFRCNNINELALLSLTCKQPKHFEWGRGLAKSLLQSDVSARFASLLKREYPDLEQGATEEVKSDKPKESTFIFPNLPFERGKRVVMSPKTLIHLAGGHRTMPKEEKSSRATDSSRVFSHGELIARARKTPAEAKALLASSACEAIFAGDYLEQAALAKTETADAALKSPNVLDYLRNIEGDEKLEIYDSTSKLIKTRMIENVAFALQVLMVALTLQLPGTEKDATIVSQRILKNLLRIAIHHKSIYEFVMRMPSFGSRLRAFFTNNPQAKIVEANLLDNDTHCAQLLKYPELAVSKSGIERVATLSFEAQLGIIVKCAAKNIEFSKDLLENLAKKFKKDGNKLTSKTIDLIDKFLLNAPLYWVTAFQKHCPELQAARDKAVTMPKEKSDQANAAQVFSGFLIKRCLQEIAKSEKGISETLAGLSSAQIKTILAVATDEEVATFCLAEFRRDPNSKFIEKTCCNGKIPVNLQQKLLEIEDTQFLRLCVKSASIPGNNFIFRNVICDSKLFRTKLIEALIANLKEPITQKQLARLFMFGERALRHDILNHPILIKTLCTIENGNFLEYLCSDNDFKVRIGILPGVELFWINARITKKSEEERNELQNNLLKTPHTTSKLLNLSRGGEFVDVVISILREAASKPDQSFENKLEMFLLAHGKDNLTKEVRNGFKNETKIQERWDTKANKINHNKAAHTVSASYSAPVIMPLSDGTKRPRSATIDGKPKEQPASSEHPGTAVSESDSDSESVTGEQQPIGRESPTP